MPFVNRTVEELKPGEYQPWPDVGGIELHHRGIETQVARQTDRMRILA